MTAAEDSGVSAGWPGGATRFLALRLLPGEDLRAALEAAFAAAPERAGFVCAAVGSLTRATLRLAGAEGASLVEGPLEIVALSGTLAPEGPHLHLAVADARGRVSGGHLLAGSPVRTTCELVIGLTDAVRFTRRSDTRTGYAELFIGRP